MFHLGVVDNPSPGHEGYKGKLVIPYITPSGVVDLRFRSIKGEDPKYIGLPGAKTTMFNAQTVRVQYTKYPTTITDNQELTVSGLPSSCEDVVRLGAMYRLLSTVDPGKVIATSVSADALDQPVSAGASTNTAKYIFQLYTVRLAEEISKQQANFLNTIQYSR